MGPFAAESHFTMPSLRPFSGSFFPLMVGTEIEIPSLVSSRLQWILEGPVLTTWYLSGDDWIVIDRLVRMLFAVNQMPCTQTFDPHSL
jgi:hypothetical protein